MTTEPDWNALIDALDVNSDNNIDYNEFVTAAYDRMSLLNKENLDKAFITLDLNGDGNIEVEELRAGFAGYMVVASDAGWQDMLNEVDTNGDGLISREEFF